MSSFFSYKNRTDLWKTPKNILDYFIKNGYKDFNPYCDSFYSNSLLKNYDSYYCNPPFSNIEPFVDYMIKCSQYYSCVLLLPVRVMTTWFYKLISNGCSICFVGRINYNDCKSSAPFDSMLVFLDKDITSCSVCWNKKFNCKDLSKMIQLSIFDL